MFAKQPAKSNSDKGSASSTPFGELPQARKTLKVATMIADDLTVDGDIKGEGELHIDGTIRGDIRIGKLTLGETGRIEGNVYADSIEVRGHIVGSVTSKTVRLFSTAHVDGDITHEQLSMEPGAFFQGRAQKFQRPTASTEADAEFTPLKTIKAVVKPAADVLLPNP